MKCKKYRVVTTAALLEHRNTSTYHVCQEDVVYNRDLEQGSHFEISLWFFSGYKFSATCYLWCTFDGQLPGTPSSERPPPHTAPDPIDDKSLAQLMNSTFAVAGADYLDKGYRETTHVISPNTAYHIVTNATLG